MSDPLREELRAATPVESDADRDAKIEQLLLVGLDHYFNKQHDQAIHIWTRVLFLDRGHARARAYIERARSALAESQRECEERLHNGVAAFNAGDVTRARMLLQSVVATGGPQEVALAFLERLDRLDTAAGHGNRRVTRPRRNALVPRRGTSSVTPSVVRHRIAVPILLALALAGGSVYAMSAWDSLEAALFGHAASPNAAGPALSRERLPVPSGSEILVARARTLFERGDLHDSLRLLDTMPVGDAWKPQADLLRASIQRALLAAVAPPAITSARRPSNPR